MTTILFITDLHAGSRIPELAGIREFAAERDWHVEEIELSRLTGPLKNAIDYWSPDGLILEGSGNLLPQLKIFRTLPVVHLDPNERILADPSAFTVTNDAAAIADFALRELARTECRHFAFVGWTHNVGWSKRREERFAERLAALGKPLSILDDPWAIGNKADFATRLRPFLAQLPRPCGIFAANDDIASVILDFCKMDAISVPGEFFVVGVDNDPAICDNLNPSLTSIRPSFKTGGRLAAALLLKRLAKPDAAPEKLIYSPLGVTARLSTRHIAVANPRVLQALDLIRREACNGLKAADVVKFLGISERLAETRFKTSVGRRITEEITEVRLAHALELLRDPRQAITPIANLCGWDSDVYLKRLFKQRYGCTMRQWRKNDV